MVAPKYKSKRKYDSTSYTPQKLSYQGRDILRSHDATRHILIDDAIKLISDQNDRSLSPKLLSDAISSQAIHVYEFKDKKYLDRIDLGRLYHKLTEKKEGLSFKREFSKAGEDPLQSVSYERRHLKITGEKGEIVFEMDDALFPPNWSDNDAQIVAQKYFFKPDKIEWKKKLQQAIGNDHENSPAHLISRVTNFFADEGERLGYFKTKKDKEAFRDDLAALQIGRYLAFNSPVQFNAGLYNEYGVKGSPGLNHWRDPVTGEVIKIQDGCNVKPQCHACFIKGPRDDLESILMHSVHEGGVFSSGSGIGQEIGMLRAVGEPLSSGGKASGPMSFLKIYDDGAGTIKSGGKSRRAARMTTMRYHHPDIQSFVKSKVTEDHKMKVLMEAGYSGGMDGEAANTVTFQNTNISVRVTDQFMDAAREDREVELRRVTDDKVVKRISARKLLQEIAFGSWRVGDPAIQYESKIQEMHTCKNSGKQNSTNPCSEYLFLDDTSCNLASLNLLAFSDEKGNFDSEKFRKAIRRVAVAQDIANDAASYPIKEIAQISPEFRTIGTGYANLGALLMRKGLPYDSDQARAYAGAITAVLTGAVGETSAEIAKKLEPFTHYELNKKPMLEVVDKHKKSLENIAWQYVPEDLKKSAEQVWENTKKQGTKYGFRNAQWTVLAPTGTISYLMGCETTGVEPAISLVINKELAGGGMLKLASTEVGNALSNLGYTKQQVIEISEHIKENNSIVGAPHLVKEHIPIFHTAFGDKKGRASISLEGHVKMLGSTQPFISGAISKTNNMPESASVKDVFDSYSLAHDLGLKAFAVFRNNSKSISALNFGTGKKSALKRGDKEDLPTKRNAYEVEVQIGGTPIHVIFSEYPDGRPGQMTFLSYKAGSDLGALLTTTGITVSKALKRGVELENIVDGWLGQEIEPKGLVIGHPYIKTAKSPLDFAAKLALLEYYGKKEFAEQPEKVKVEELRGAVNGAFRTYQLRNLNLWSFEDVINDPILGGFTKNEGVFVPKGNGESDKAFNNSGGVACGKCGKLMQQTAPNCFKCTNCGDSVGGCGQ
jgi:ribonucleoside-diphosphate reductase alpha chain